MITPLKNWQLIKRGYKHGSRTFYSKHHLGTDYLVNEEPIYAPKDCQIIVSKRFIQGGNTIWVKFEDEVYGELIMRCLHLRSLPSLGKYSEGDVLAYTGNTGLSTGPHLHLDLSKKDVQLNNFSNFIDPDIFFNERANVEFIKKWEGKFIQDVDVLGEVYYVYNGKRYYIGPETTVQNIAERFATGFKHSNIERIPKG